MYQVYNILNNLSRLDSLAHPTIWPIVTALFFLISALRSVNPLTRAANNLPDKINLKFLNCKLRDDFQASS